MLEQFVLLIPTLVSGFFLLRLMLIFAGILKDPILRQLQTYSDSYTYYYPFPAVTIWLGVFLTCGAFLIMQASNSRFPLYIPGFLCWFLALLSIQYSGWWMTHLLWMLPRWYRELIERAARDEQRRIAYAWIRMPYSTRRHLNAHDSAFAVWADLIILSTTVTTADTFVYARNYRLLKTRIASS